MSLSTALPPATDDAGAARARTVFERGQLTRSVPVGSSEIRSHMALGGVPSVDADMAQTDPLGTWWRAILQGAVPSVAPDSTHGGDADTTSAMRVPCSQSAGPAPRRTESSVVRVADLFCGIGGFLVGAGQLATDAGAEQRCELAVDIDADALAVHQRNHATRRAVEASVTSLIDYRIRGTGVEAEFVYPPEMIDDELAAACEEIDLVAAGPPCQGHSNLNNRSRRNDRRNLLYLAVPAFAVACRARSVAIENVTSVVHDGADVVATTKALLSAYGYSITEGVLAADDMGWPQTRRRHFLIARRLDAPGGSGPLPLTEVRELLAQDRPRSVVWAIGGTQALSHDPAMHDLPEYTEANRGRMAWLFDNEEHDLALAERPECHQDGTSYGAVYGRMYGDRPAPTITTGFMTPGRGRFVHPTERRTLTAAEAARLQGFPDGYVFQPGLDKRPTRAQLAKWIGDAVTAPLGYAAALSALAPALVS